MESTKVKDLREIAKSEGLRGYSRLKKSDLVCLIESHDKEIGKRDFLIEVCEDSNSDLSDCDPIFKKDKTKKNKVKVFKYGSTVIEVCEDSDSDLSDCDPIFKKDKTKKNKVKVFKYGSAVIEVCEDNSEDLPDGW